MVFSGQEALRHTTRRPITAMSHISLDFIANALMFLPSLFGLTL